MSDGHYEGGMPLIYNRRCTCEKCCPVTKKGRVMSSYSYRVIILGTNWYAVRRFADGNCEEARFDFDAHGDPQLRETEKRIIAEANRLGEWRKVR